MFTDPYPEMEKISNLFKEKGVRRILDLGCGNGRHLIYLSKKGFEVYCMEQEIRNTAFYFFYQKEIKNI